VKAQKPEYGTMRKCWITVCLAFSASVVTATISIIRQKVLVIDSVANLLNIGRVRTLKICTKFV
jgi:hypothetical protein